MSNGVIKEIDLSTTGLNEPVVVKSADLLKIAEENPAFINLITEIFNCPIKFIKMVNRNLSQFNNNLRENLSTSQIFNLAKIILVVYKARVKKYKTELVYRNYLVYDFLLNLVRIIETRKEDVIDEENIQTLYKNINTITPYGRKPLFYNDKLTLES